jgi:16S rRNA (guanine966-N2)-methyltransferase
LSRIRITGGEWRSRLVQIPGAPGLRPTPDRVRETLFNWLGQDLGGQVCLDLFAGSGALGFEALSRGAAFACFVENDPAAVRAIKDNIAALSVPTNRSLVLHKDVGAALTRGPQQFPKPARHGFGLVCIDPPYGQDLLWPTLAAVLDNGWAADEGFILAEIEARPRQGAVFDPACDHRLEPLVDRAYGQTRILLWRTTQKQIRPSTQAPSTP